MLSSLSIERYYCNMLHVTCYIFELANKVHIIPFCKRYV